MALCSHDHKQRSLPLAMSNCMLEFPQTHINARFLSHIDNFGSPLDDRYHLEFDYQAGNMERVSPKTWRQLKNGLTLVRTVV